LGRLRCIYRAETSQKEKEREMMDILLLVLITYGTGIVFGYLLSKNQFKEVNYGKRNRHTGKNYTHNA